MMEIRVIFEGDGKGNREMENLEKGRRGKMKIEGRMGKLKKLEDLRKGRRETEKEKRRGGRKKQNKWLSDGKGL